MTPPLTLIGDGIENPWNARTLLHAATMFGGDCAFRDRAKLAAAWRDAGLPDGALRTVTPAEVVTAHSPIIACDTDEDAASIYGFRLPRGERPAVIVGNERRGIAHDMRAIAGHMVRIPLPSRTLGSLNVAAAAAVALHYLASGGGGALHRAQEPQQRRPELLLIGGADHWELGSAIRSAGAFGWQRILVEDRAGVWFGADRATRSEGRAAARRARNPIRLIPARATDRYAFARAVVVTTRRQGVPLHRATLAGGPRTAVVLADESGVHLPAEEWSRLGARVEFAHIALPATDYAYHYRLLASIALAEIARQVGQPSPDKHRLTRRDTPTYDFALPLHPMESGEMVFLEDLEAY